MKLSQKRNPKPKVRIKEINFQGPDFILNYENPSDGYSEFPSFYLCNLYLPKTVNKGKYNERTELKWYSTTSSKEAISEIILFRILNSENTTFKGKGDEGLAKFLKKYREEKENIISLFKHSKEDWLNLLECDVKKKSYNAKLTN